MTRNLKALGPALVVALALSAVIASAAAAAPALFTANVGANEQAETHSEQVGTGTFTINGQVFTCATVRETGFLEENGTHKKGPSAPSLTLTPTFEVCHTVAAGLTKTATVTTNGCTYTATPTKNTAGFSFSVDLTLNCPIKPMELHVYNSANANDAGVAVLCTYDLSHQTMNNQIELTNAAGTPDDILAHVNVTVEVKNTIKSALCGQNDTENAVYKGTHTLRATNEAGQFVNTTVS